MTSISVKARVKPDGTLQLAVPTGLPESEVDVLLVIRPLNTGSANAGSTDSWPAGFFDDTFGSLADRTLVRPAQLPLEAREKLL